MVAVMKRSSPIKVLMFCPLLFHKKANHCSLGLLLVTDHLSSELHYITGLTHRTKWAGTLVVSALMTPEEILNFYATSATSERNRDTVYSVARLLSIFHSIPNNSAACVLGTIA